jgi:hypothetical protein
MLSSHALWATTTVPARESHGDLTALCVQCGPEGMRACVQRACIVSQDQAVGRTWLVERPMAIASSTFLSEQTIHQQPANSTFLSKQTSTRHQPPAKRTRLYEAIPNVSPPGPACTVRQHRSRHRLCAH